MAEIVFWEARGSATATFHVPAPSEPGELPRTLCGRVLGCHVPQARRETAERSAAPCRRCYALAPASPDNVTRLAERALIGLLVGETPAVRRAAGL